MQNQNALYLEIEKKNKTTASASNEAPNGTTASASNEAPNGPTASTNISSFDDKAGVIAGIIAILIILFLLGWCLKLVNMKFFKYFQYIPKDLKLFSIFSFSGKENRIKK